MQADYYLALKKLLEHRGYGDEFKWAQGVKPCPDAGTFFTEACWVIINGGMKEQVARIIWNRIRSAWAEGKKAADVFGHKGKSEIIERLRRDRTKMFAGFKRADDKLKFLRTIPFIGPITVYHLARNLGLDFAKPDRHLVRITDGSGETPQQLCERLSRETGDRVGAVDAVIWRAANLGLA